MQAPMMEQKMATTAIPRGSAPAHFTPISAIADHRAAFSNEAVKALIGSRLRRILQSLDDFIHPIMGVKHLLGHDLSPGLVELGHRAEYPDSGDREPEAELVVDYHAGFMRLKSEALRLVPYCLPYESVQMAKAESLSLCESGFSIW